MTLVLGSGFIFEIMGIMEARHDSFEVIDAMPILLYSIIEISKMFCWVHTLPKIKILLIKMKEYYLSPKSDDETKIQNLHAQYGRKLGYAYTGCLLAHNILYVFSGLMVRFYHTEIKKSDEISNKAQLLPHRVNYMIDLDTYYVPIFIHSFICDFTYTYLLVVSDVLYLTMVEYCCGLFAALRYHLKTALVFENNRLMTITRDMSYTNIARSIQKHTEIMQFVAVVESVYGLPLFIHVGLTTLILSVLGYQVISNIENINRLAKPIPYLSGVLFNLFLENWLGQKIIDSSEKVFQSAYNIEWYNMPIAARKLLIMLMMKSEKPSTLKMGKIAVLSYVTFNTVLRTASSYFMLLLSLR